MAGKSRLNLHPRGLSVEVLPHTTVLQALKKLGIDVRSDCGGTGRCGKCLIICHERDSLAPPGAGEADLLNSAGLRQGYRMACQAEIVGKATVSLVETAEDGCTTPGKTITATRTPPNPAVRRIHLAADTVVEEDSVFDRLLAGIRAKVAGQIPSGAADDIYAFELSALQHLSTIKESTGLTLVVHEVRGITAVLEGNRAASLGLAVDIGTTTIAVYLCDLTDGTLLTSASSFNPQRSSGDDVISRISAAAQNDEALRRLQKSVAGSINLLATRCLEHSGVAADAIDEVVVVGNTTMQTIFTGISPESLGRSPYLPTISRPLNLRAKDLGLTLTPGTNVYVFPVISAFLGGDAVGAALGDFLHLQDKTTLIIDIGTNGEIMLGNREKVLATSCATGPALEGASISCGMRAINGAIDRVIRDEHTGELLCRTIGEEIGYQPSGICGSGLIDAMATLRTMGILLESGRLLEGCPGVICDDSGIGQAYVLVPEEKSGTGSAIVITLRDIRAFQLAKSALAVGIEKLLDVLEVDEVHRTVITGAFGAHFDWRNGVAVGMIPARVTHGETYSVKNLAGVGAVLALLDKGRRRQAEKLAAQCHCIDLAMDQDFNDRFVAGTRFPSL